MYKNRQIRPQAATHRFTYNGVLGNSVHMYKPTKVNGYLVPRVYFSKIINIKLLFFYFSQNYLRKIHAYFFSPVSFPRTILLCEICHLWFIVEVVSSSDKLPDVVHSEEYLIKA